MTTTNRLTAAQVAALRTILAAGGIRDAEVHSGRRRPGTVQTALVNRMVAAGLLECVRDERAAEPYGFAADGRPLYVWSHRYFATAKACIMLAAVAS